MNAGPHILIVDDHREMRDLVSRALDKDGFRVSYLPDVPTIAETVPGVETSTWEGFFAPAGTPQPIIDRLYEATKKALASPEVQQKLTHIGIVPKLSSPDELKRTVHEDLKFWRQAVDTAGLEPR